MLDFIRYGLRRMRFHLGVGDARFNKRHVQRYGILNYDTAE